MKTLSQTFRSIKRPIQNPKLSKSSSSPSKSELKINAKPKSESWCVYLILSTNHPIKTYVGVTTNFPRRLKEHNGELKGGAKASRAGRPWICACIVCGFTNRSEALVTNEPNPGTLEGLDKNIGYIVTGVKTAYGVQPDYYKASLFERFLQILSLELACVFESKWKALSKRIPRKNHIDNDDPSKKSEDRSRPLLQHRQAALNKVETSLDCTNLEINWHLDPL